MDPVETTQTTPTETAPSAEPAQKESVYGEPSAGAYSDPAKALAGERQSQIREAQQKADARTAPPPGQRFGLNEERKQELAAQLKAEKAHSPVATTVAPAKAKKPAVDSATVVGDLFDREDSEADFLGRLYDHDYARYERLVSHVITSNRDHALRTLGVDLGPRADDPEFSHLPEELREIAADLRPDIWESLSLADPREQVFHLERELELQQREQAEWEAQERERQEARERIRQEGFDSIQTLNAKYEKQIFDSLADFQPYDSDEDNKAIHTQLGTVVFNEMLRDPEAAQAYQDMTHFLLLAPQLRAQGRSKDAQMSEQYGEQLAEALTKEFISILSEYKGQLVAVFANDRSWRELQKSKDAPPDPITAPILGDLAPPPGERFGLSEARKQQLAAELKKARNAAQQK